MCFKRDNENFIRIKLFSEMKGLSDVEKSEKYFLLRDEVHKRLNESYDNCNSKVDFYKDILEILSFYEGGYILLNLFLEEDAVTIIDSLIIQNALKDFDISLLSTETLSYKLYNYILSKKYFNDQYLKEFTTNLLQNIINEDGEYEWEINTTQTNNIINNIYTYISNNINTENNSNNLVVVFYLFIKIWNYYPDFKKPFNNIKAILFYEKINNSFEKDQVNYYNFLDKIRLLFTELFVTINYIPLVDEIEGNISKIIKPDSESELKTWNNYHIHFINRQDKFKELFTIALKLSNINYNNSFLELIERVNEIENIELYNKSKAELIKKMELFIFPNQKELERINDIIELNTYASSLKNLLFSKIYLY